MKKNIYIFILIALSFKLWGGTWNMVLEYEKLSDFKVVEEKNGNDIVLQISGLCMHSNYVVKKIECKTIKDKLKVIIRISVFKKKNESGRFVYEIKIPNGIKQIVFGNNEIEIWKSK